MDDMIKSHKIRLNPTEEQQLYLWKACHVARFAFNWGLGEYNRRKAAGQEAVKITGKGDCLIKEFVMLRQTEFAWTTEVTSYAYQGAFADLKKAISNYYTRKKNSTLRQPPAGWKPRKDGKPFGWPRFKARDKTTPAFYLANLCMKFDEYCVKLEKCPGRVNMTQPLRFEGKIMGGRVSYHANQWWLSVQVDLCDTPAHGPVNDATVGVDLGVKYLAVTHNGNVAKYYANPKPLHAALKKLARMQRSWARMTKGGQNWLKMKARIAALHYRITCIRNEASHQLTAELTQAYGIIGLEDLNVSGMMSNRKLSKAIADAALYEKRRQFEYKSQWNGGEVLYVDRWFPSSKMCSNCGAIKADLTLNDRQWACPNCQTLNERDANAAMNIRNEVMNRRRSTHTES